MSTRTVTATQLKNHLGEYLEAAITAPVFVQKSGREVAVLVSREHYMHLQALEDELWAVRALLAEQNGYLGVEETARVLKTRLFLEYDAAC